MNHTDPITPQDTLHIPTELFIPKISDNRLEELYSNIKPLVDKGDENKYTLRSFTTNELRNFSYIGNTTVDSREIVNPDDLEPIQDFYCLHTWAYYGLFKPTIAEVLSQIPEEVIKEINFFEIIEKPETADDLFKYLDILNAGFHLSKVRTYRLKAEE